MEKSSISRIMVHTVSFIVVFVSSQTLFISTIYAAEKFFGTVWQNWSSQDQAFPELDGIFDQLTPENAGKWGSCERNRGNFNWPPLDAMYKYAGNRNFPVKQHTFVWGMQEPGWIQTLSSSEQKTAVINWMTEYMKRYSDVEYIDVVNEPISWPPSYKNAIGGSGSTGWDWVIWTFEKARELAPNAKLILNEHSTLSSSSKRSKYLTIINLLKDRGLIDYIGLQGHWLEGLSSSAIQNALDEYETTKLYGLCSKQ
jgi:endo-1,4-beta-xylanase